MRYYMLFVFSLFAIIGNTQDLLITDQTTGMPIPDVAIINYAETHSAISDSKGIAPIGEFQDTDTLLLQHTSYQTIMLPVKKLDDMNYEVSLYPSVIHLEETVISAHRWEEKKQEVPMKIRRIPEQEMEQLEAQTTADVLANTGEVFVQKSQLGGGSPMIRGFATNKVLIVVDGVRMNNPIYRHGNLQNVISVDPNSLETSEVIFGPGSVIYGSDAIGGVMDFHTKTAELAEDGTIFKANAMLRYQSANTERSGHIDFVLGNEKFSSFTSLSYSDFGDMKMGSEGFAADSLSEYYLQDSVIGENDRIIENKDPYLQQPSAYHQMNILQKLRYQPVENWDLQYAFHYSTTSNIPRYDRMIQKSDGRLKYADWYYGPQKWMMHQFQVWNKSENILYDDLRIQLAFQDYEESRHDRKRLSETLRHRTEAVKMGTLNMDMSKKLNKKQTVFYGLDGSMSKIFSDAYNENIQTEETRLIGTRYPDNSDYSSAAAYLSYRYKLNKRWIFNAAGRYSYVYAYAPFDTTQYAFSYDEIVFHTAAPNANLGVVCNIRPDWNVNAALSSGFRAPNIDDLGKVFDSEPGAVVVPNPDLKPEYAYNLDLRSSKQFGDIIRLEAGGFYTILNNAMARDDFLFEGQDSIMYDGEKSAVQAIQNIGRVDVYGGSLSFYADILPQVSLKSTVTYTKGEDQDGNPYRHVAPLFGNTHIIFHTKKLRMDVYAVYNGAITPENLSPEEHGKTYMYAVDREYAEAQAQLAPQEQFNSSGLYAPAWATLNLKLSYHVNEKLFINAGIENITDRLYRPYSSGIAAPGRNFIISLRAAF